MKKKSIESVYTPQSPLRKPIQFVAAMFGDLIYSRELAWRLLCRNISAKYRQTILGYLWAFLPPLVTTATFSFLNSQKIFNIGKTNIPYPAFVLIGTLFWQVLVESIHSPFRVFKSSKSFLGKINFPKEALFWVSVGEVLFNFCIKAFLLIPVLLWFRIPLPSTIIIAPLGLLSIISLGLTIEIWLMPIGMLYHDIQKGMRFITSVWIFLTPVVYPPPSSWPASLLVKLNPASPLIVTAREMLTTGNISQLSAFIVVSLLTVVFLFIGWILLRTSLPFLIERMGS